VDSGRFSGGILKLRELISEHPSELTYDLRSRFGLSIRDIGYALPYDEAIALVSVLMRDPSSWIQAVWNDWKYPVSHDWIMAWQTLELLKHAHSSKKPKPHPTPWPDASVTRTGKTNLPQDKVRMILDSMRPKEDDGTNSTGDSIR
jgi:hypothetical protein